MRGREKEYVRSLAEEHTAKSQPDRDDLTKEEEAVELAVAFGSDHCYDRYDEESYSSDSDTDRLRVMVGEKSIHYNLDNTYIPYKIKNKPEMWKVLPITYAVKNRHAIAPPNSGPKERLIM